MSPTPDPATADRFWLGRCELALESIPAPIKERLPDSLAGPFALVVDVLQGGADPAAFSVMLSVLERADAPGNPGPLRCMLAFGNRTESVDRLRQRGFMALDAQISHDSTARMLHVLPQPVSGAGTPTPQELHISGLRFRAATKAVGADHGLWYTQLSTTPEAGAVSRELQECEDLVDFGRRGVLPLDGSATISATGSGALPLIAGQGWKLAVTGQWCGRLTRATDAVLKQAGAGSGKPHNERRRGLLRRTGFRFDDVELIGLRINLRHLGEDAEHQLMQWIEPLNFHLRDADKPSSRLHFRYRPAACSLVVELLRYGRMYFGIDKPEGGEDEPYESQYELLVRVLVGRVDDGSAQARDPAVYVPAIYVDSPLSRLYGRELQGFDKRLASFMDAYGDPLSAAPGHRREPGLADLRCVQAVTGLPATRDADLDLLHLDLPADTQRWFDGAEPLDDLARSFTASRWRQGDFSHKEFRRSFARDVLAEGLESFRSIQVAPVDDRPLDPAWITGTFQLQDLRAAFPNSMATLTLPRHSRLLPEPLRKLLGEQPIALGSGDWYVGRCKLHMRLEDGLL